MCVSEISLFCQVSSIHYKCERRQRQHLSVKYVSRVHEGAIKLLNESVITHASSASKLYLVSLTLSLWKWVDG